MKKTFFTTLVLLAFCIVPVRANWTISTVDSAININNGYADQIEHTSSDKYIIYTDYSDNTFLLYLYSITTGESKLLDEQTNDKFQPSIDGNDIVWTTSDNGKKYITHYKINSEEESVFAMSGNYHDTHPYIQGNIITFIRWNLSNGNSSVMLYNIVEDTLTSVDSGQNTNQTNQKHYGNTVVWQDFRNNIDEIYIKQIIDEEMVIKNLSDNGLNHYFPKISGTNVIWDTKNSVYVKNLDDQSLQIIGSDQYANFYSSIDGNNIVYQSKRSESFDIYLYNLKTKTETRLTNSYQNDESPTINGNIVSWRRQNNAGRYDIHYMNIKSAIEDLYSHLSFEAITTADVKITWPEYNQDDYTGAILYKSNTGTNKGLIIGHHLTDFNFTDTNLVPGENYYYTLTLINSNGQESTFSNQYIYKASNRRLVKLANSPTVYLLDQNNTYAISNEDVFNAHNFNWSEINTISQSVLDDYHYSGPLKYPNGTLVNSNYNANVVYLVYNDSVRPFANEEIFIRAGYKWGNIKNISQTMFNTYTVSEELNVDNFIHPNNSLIKYTYNPDVYLIENGSKRLITNENTFHQHEFNWYDVMTIPVYWEYSTGQNL